MAISHALPSLLLLASLFFLPALCAINFKYCNESGYDYGTVTRVEISPNPVTTEEYPSIVVFGSASKASKSISAGMVEVDMFLKSEDNRRINLETYDLCDDLHACPIEPGKNFVLNMSDVYYSRRIEGGLLAVTLIDYFGESDDYLDPKTERIMCINFYLPTTPAPTILVSST